MDDAQRTRLRKRLARTMVRTLSSHRLLAPGDRVLVAVSGGKDSYTMLDLLWEARRRAPIPFELVGCAPRSGPARL